MRELRRAKGDLLSFKRENLENTAPVDESDRMMLDSKVKENRMNNTVLQTRLFLACLLFVVLAQSMAYAEEVPAEQPSESKQADTQAQANEATPAGSEAEEEDLPVLELPAAKETESGKDGPTEASAEGELPVLEMDAPPAGDANTAEESAPKEAPEADEDNVEVEIIDETGGLTPDGQALDTIDESAVTVELGKGRTGTINYKGCIKERGSKKPIAYATVQVVGNDSEAITDEKGCFEFIDAPSGEVKVVVAVVNYEKFETTESLSQDAQTQVTYYLEPKFYGVLEVVVRGKKKQKEVSRKVIKREELRVIPGANNDAVRVVENLPGVSEVSGQGLVIRGSNAEDSRVLVDGQDIPQLFHFGGLKSVYNSDLLDDITLTTGGFGVEYGDATGGIVELTTRSPNDERLKGYVDTSMLDVTVLLEGPTSESTRLAGAFRRSTIDLILLAAMPRNEDFAFTVYPSYYDYQLAFEWDINEDNRLDLDFYGSVDTIEALIDSANEEEPEITGSFGVNTIFNKFVAHWRYKNDALNYKHRLSQVAGQQSLDFQFGSKYTLKIEPYDFNTRYDGSVAVGDHNTLGFGLISQPTYFVFSSNLPRPPKEGDGAYSLSNADTLTLQVKDWIVDGGLYFNDTFEYERFTVVPGLRLDYRPAFDQYAVDPRVQVRVRAAKPLVIKAAAGLYHRFPDYDELYEPFGNDGLEMEQAIHFVTGLEWDITELISLDVQGYYKDLSKMVVRIDESRPNPNNLVYDNGGRGYVAGGELLLRHNMTERFFGWISYSFSKAMRNDGPGTPMRPFDGDQTHNLTILGSYKIGKTWQLGGRFQLKSGAPYTDTLDSIYVADTGTYVPVSESNKNRSRLPLFHSLDLRLDKFWRFETWILTTYLDVQNVYYQKNVQTISYNFDYSEKALVSFIRILPSLGIRADF